MAHLQVPLDEIIRWHDSPIPDEFKSADLPQNWFAVVYKRWDDIWIAILGCRAEPESPVVCGVFARFGSAQGWIEDKAILLHQGKPLVYRRERDDARI